MKSVLLFILCNSVGGYMLGNIGKSKINIKMNLESPVNIVNKFANGRAGIGEPWTIQELSSRVDKDNIEGVSLIVKDNVVNGLVAIDKNYNELIEHLVTLFPQWISVADRLPRDEGLYLHLWPSGAIDTLGLEPLLRYLKCFSTHSWLGPLPQPPKEES